MTREEAIEILRNNVCNSHHVYDNVLSTIIEALAVLVPELRENEDERVRKTLIEFLTQIKEISESGRTTWTVRKGDAEMCKSSIAYLEKQKENIEKEYVFRPLAGTDITIAAEQAIRRADEGDRLVLAFNGAYIPVRKGVNANKIVDIYDGIIEKQKDASKAIEVVERIDKYIDENLANAHDMKDSNPDKKYYRGWDDALGEMARILQDVYSGEKQKEQKPIFRVGDTIIAKDGTDIPQEAFHIERIEDGYYWDKEGGSILIGHQDEFQLVEQKLAEWSEEDKEALDMCLDAIPKRWKTKSGILLTKWLKDNIHLQPKQEWSEEDKEKIVTISEIIEHCTTIPYSGGTLTLNKEYKKELLCFIKSLRPSWKPSKEQVEALEDTMAYIPEFYKPKSNLASLLRDLKKQI